MGKEELGTLSGIDEILNEAVRASLDKTALADIDRKLPATIRPFGYCTSHPYVRKMLKTPPPRAIDENFVGQLFNRMVENLARRDGPSSASNWWFRPRKSPSSIKSRDCEVLLEREIAFRFPTAGPGEWTYQMPVASGLFRTKKKSPRAVDLVYSANDGSRSYDLVELKVSLAAGTPIFAAMEVLKYGLVYLATRLDIGRCRHPEPKGRTILDARAIKLCVLAPASYYEEYASSRLTWLSSGIDTGLQNLRSQHNSDELPTMTFEFQRFPDTFDWNCRSKKLSWDGKRIPL